MAVDEAILREVGAGRSAPTLRFYRWNPPTLSVGRFQQVRGQIDVEGCRRLGIGLVRRPTGGRAVLHDDEVTYSVVLPEAAGLPASVTAAYRLLSIGLAEGLRLLGIEPEFLKPVPRKRAESPAHAVPEGSREAATPASSGRADLSALCFEAPSWYELAAAGKKLVGSAQLRRFGGLLQHGSLLLRLERERVAPLVGGSGSAAAVLQAATSLEEVLGRYLPFDEAVEAMQEGFRRALGWVLEPGDLSTREEKKADWLARYKYGTDAWNLDRTEPEEPWPEEERAGA